MRRRPPLVARFLLTSLIAALCLSRATLAREVGDPVRYLLSGTATPEVFAALIKKPEDRSENAGTLMKAAGCELVDYYVGISDYKSYIIMECAQAKSLGALQMLIYASGSMVEGQAVQIVTSAELKDLAVEAGKLVEYHRIPE